MKKEMQEVLAALDKEAKPYFEPGFKETEAGRDSFVKLLKESVEACSLFHDLFVSIIEDIEDAPRIPLKRSIINLYAGLKIRYKELRAEFHEREANGGFLGKE